MISIRSAEIDILAAIVLLLLIIVSNYVLLPANINWNCFPISYGIFFNLIT